MSIPTTAPPRPILRRAELRMNVRVTRTGAVGWITRISPNGLRVQVHEDTGQFNGADLGWFGLHELEPSERVPLTDQGRKVVEAGMDLLRAERRR